MNEIDLRTISDIKELKSLAYDQMTVRDQAIATRDQAEANLKAINDRLQELYQDQGAKEAPKVAEEPPTE